MSMFSDLTDKHNLYVVVLILSTFKSNILVKVDDLFMQRIVE